MNIAHRICPDLKTYAAAQKFCETAAMNGFKTGRLVEPKTQSFNDKVYAEARVSFGFRSFWMGITAKGGAWVYASSGTKIGFENWYKFIKSKNQKVKSGKKKCVSSSDGKWINHRCNNNWINFICEFV